MVTSRTLIATALAASVAEFLAPSATAQPARSAPTQVTIPFLANATKPTALEFEGAECAIEAGGNRMTCAFEQLFVTTSSVAPDTCLVTTNHYDRIFQYESPGHWTSSEGPAGACGLLDVATLTDEGGVKWTLEFKKEVTRKEGSVACLTLKPETEIFSWQNIRRPLPCRNIQPGALR